jgi:16S rRNA pseudouridine516 synthase
MKRIRTDKLLANLGYGSRREVSMAVRSGVFIVGGVAQTDPSATLPLDSQILNAATYRGEALDPVSPFTLMLNKPRTYTCSRDEQGLLVYDLLPERWNARSPALSSAGRLDKDSTGLVILTDGGDFLHRVISPKHHVWKQYAVTLRDSLKGNETDLFAAGDFLLDADASPLKPARWDVTGVNSGIMSLQEGRYRQIRRMFARLDNEVESLHRFSIGGLELGDLAEGEYRILTAEDLQKIFATS